MIGADRRRVVDSNYERLNDLGIAQQIEFVYFDLKEDSIIFDIIRKEQPDEFYNQVYSKFRKSWF